MLCEFFGNIQNGPTYECSVCSRFLYSTSVKRVSEQLVSQASNTIQVAHGRWICHTCANAIVKGKLPAQAIDNNLRAAEVPQELSSLSSLERQLVSKIIPFMKIVSLPKGSQRGLKGQVVLVPSDTTKTVSSLPRNTTDAQIIALTLKRRLSDKSSVSKEYIRPHIVNGAFSCLKAINSHYSEISNNETWSDDSASNDNQLWISTCADSVETESSSNETESQSSAPTEELTETITDSEDEVEKDAPQTVIEDLTLKRTLNSVTCLYPEQGPSVTSNKILNLAPAEGQIPTSVFYEKNWETLAFPALFPDGRNTYHQPRVTHLSERKYVNARLLSSDTRFAESAEYTFQCLHWIETLSVNDSISMSLKKTRDSDISVGQLQHPERLQAMFKENEIFASFKKVRGSPQYWQEMQQDMLAKIRRFGTYTFFLSGSAADFHWPELIRIVAQQYGEDISLEYIEKEMDKTTKRNWLARNPVTVAKHIDFIFRKLWGNVILSGIHPIGQILNYDIRKEMQSRGTAHFHPAVHVKNAPEIDKSTDEEVIAFVDQHISCSLPENDESLKNLVASRQVHHHTRTCKKKKGINCRFHFPKPPSSTTTIARVPVDEQANQKKEKARAVMNQVMDKLEKGFEGSLEDLLKEAHVSSEDYQTAVETSAKKTNIILQRHPSEVNVNPYNPVILKALRANMDIQFITDVWACVAYITSYMCKPERTMSELMRNACKEAETVKDKLKAIGNVFLKSREVSQHEAIARLLSMPLKESNTPVIFIPTGFKNQRTRLLKPNALLQTMDDDDTDVFLPNIIDKYAARPSSLDKLCLAEFASQYGPCTYTPKHQNDDDGDDTAEKVDRGTGQVITLKDGMGKMKKRSIPYVLRDYPVSKSKDSEKYYHRLLLLYLPWRKEEELEDMDNFEKKFNKVQDAISTVVKEYEPYIEEVQQASEVCESFDDEEIWDRLAPEAEQNREEEVTTEENNPFEPENLTSEQLEQDEIINVPNENQKQRSLSSNVALLSTTKYNAAVRSLNKQQREIHDYIFQWCRSMTLATSLEEKPKPFHLFLSGGAGVGKSHTVHAIFQSATRCLRKSGDNPDLPYVTLTAPTGKAAVNIGGTTLHNAFRLPVRQRGSHYQFRQPTTNCLNMMRATYCQLKILIIDDGGSINPLKSQSDNASYF